MGDIFNRNVSKLGGVFTSDEAKLTLKGNLGVLVQQLLERPQRAQGPGVLAVPELHFVSPQKRFRQPYPLCPCSVDRPGRRLATGKSEAVSP